MRNTKLHFYPLLILGFAAFSLIGFREATANTSRAQAAPMGLNFPSNSQTSADIRFKFSGPNLQAMYPATYIWRVNLRRQAGYYTTFFWGPDGPFTGTSFYGAHPYPNGEPKPSSTAHKWELSIDGRDIVDDLNKHATDVQYDTWKTQALRVFDNGVNKVHLFYWDLPDTTKVIQVLLDRNYGNSPPLNPALTFGDAPWNKGAERLSGILRGLQFYSASISLKDLISEIADPLSTVSGKSTIWYLNLDPTPDDITDKSGKNHHPQWISTSHAALWTGPSSALHSKPKQGKSKPAEMPDHSISLTDTDATTIKGQKFKVIEK